MTNYRTIVPFGFEEACAGGTHPQIKGHASLPFIQQFGSMKQHLDLFMLILLATNINPAKYGHSTIQQFNLPYMQHQDYSMDATHYWPFAREYSIWDATVAALQIWIADLDPHILSNPLKESIQLSSTVILYNS